MMRYGADALVDGSFGAGVAGAGVAGVAGVGVVAESPAAALLVSEEPLEDVSVVVGSDGGVVGVAGAGVVGVTGAEAETVTTRETEPVFPALSVAVYVTVYMPAVFVSTVPLTTIELEIFAPLASVAVAPGSVNTPPWSTEIAPAPLRVTVGLDDEGVLLALPIIVSGVLDELPVPLSPPVLLPVLPELPVLEPLVFVGVLLVLELVVLGPPKRLASQLLTLNDPTFVAPIGVLVAICPLVWMMR
jgi:hypothetical protein